MIHRLCVLLFALAALIAASSPARAHPHVWVTMKSELIYAADGTVTGVRHAWTFDDMFSTFATQGLETKQKGVFTREDLAPLAEVNVSSLKEYDFFSQARVNGKKAKFSDPTDYWLEFKDSVLTLHFTLPLSTPAKVQALDLEIYDPGWFVDFSFAEKDPVALVGAPAQCKLAVVRPNDPNQNKQMSEDLFNSMAQGNNNFGAQFASKISVKCP